MFECAILKLTARCNLACTYCYMFNLQDNTYRRVPARMPVETALAALDRIETHLYRYESGKPFTVVLHGGEPSIWPDRSFQVLLERLAAMRGRGLPVSAVMQSNGVRLRPSLLELLAKHDVSIGISLDGPEARNDVSRVTHQGEGSYTRVMRTVDQLIENGYGRLLAGFLAVADPSCRPAEFLDWLAGLPVRRVDVLWPIEFNYGAPPWGIDDEQDAYVATPRYGRWFADLFTEWWRRDDPSLSVRLFFDTIGILLGGQRHTDSIVNDRISAFVVNTDGGVEYPDYFRGARDGGARTTFDVFRSPLHELACDPVFDYCLNLQDYLPPTCVGCRHVKVCGGGFLPGRMDPAELVPSKRSILCADLYYFFTVVTECVAAAPVPQATLPE